MQEKLYNNRKTLLYIGIILTILGVILGYYMYEVEPWETIGGAISGLGFSMCFISLTIKHPEQVK
ncbi:hypothetical protein [Tenacibaculum sp. IB213877]|uniref:hypothetical protein n=1 Tax=Tenacibaculum sp. IB213877 TaxID=3097351 RepID=UPI002A5B0DC2|nr:hypothetical protein [Tenacibaculum sp. IB213877]MDY0780590.1 hypothetical protein [Tenacibaculum sp. IB213877]